MKPTSLLIPALGLFASSATSAAIPKRSNAAVPRAETLSEGVVTFPDVSKRGDDPVEGVITGVEGTVDGVLTGVEGTVDGVLTGVGDTIDGVLTGSARRRRGEDHSDGVVTFPDVSKREDIRIPVLDHRPPALR